MRLRLTTLVLFGSSAAAAFGASGQPPVHNIEDYCAWRVRDYENDAAKSRSYNKCMAEEITARAAIETEWAEIPEDRLENCSPPLRINHAGVPVSYAQMRLCLRVPMDPEKLREEMRKWNE